MKESLKYLKFIFLFIIINFFFSISCNKKNEIEISFYYKKKIFKLSNTDKKFLEENQIDNLYIHYYDVGLNLNSEAVPSNVVLGENFIKNKKIIPVIFIHNEVFEKLNRSQIDTLVNRMVLFSNDISKSRQIKPFDVMFDCIWTNKSKENYFYFINKYKILSGQNVLATMRFNHYKDLNKIKLLPIEKIVLIADEENKDFNKLKNYPLPITIALSISTFEKNKNQKLFTDMANNISNQIKSTNEIIIYPFDSLYYNNFNNKYFLKLKTDLE